MNFKDLSDGSTKIYIKVPKRFRNLWITKLSNLQTTDEEIREYEDVD